MNKKIHWIVCLVTLFSISLLPAQKAVYKAKLQYDLGQFESAKQGLQDYLSENPTDIEAHYQLASCHYAMGQWSDCNYRLEKITHLNTCPAKAYLLYGKSLQQVGRLQEAKDNYLRYASSDALVGQHFAQGIDFAMEGMSIPSKHDIISMPYNSSSDDFGLSFYNNVPVFSSFRTDILMDEMQKASNTHEGSYKSYYYTNKKHHFIKGINQKLDGIGPLSFSSNGEYVALVESNMTPDCNVRCDQATGILYLTKINKTGDIVEHKPFVHNEMGASIHSAHFAYDGKAVYFASNRSGGFGGFDLYVSYLKNEVWTLPVNLGASVNTAGDEITPYYDNGAIYFASNYHHGFGGYDVFISHVHQGAWTAPTNMGHGINSIGDDYFPVKNSKGEFFITSNRLGGKGKNDIYKAVQVTGDEEAFISAVSVDLMPKAVSLESLEEKHDVSQTKTKAVAYKENVETTSTFIMPEYEKNRTAAPEAEFSLTGARRIALGNIAPSGEVFFIQLASVSHLEPNLSRFSKLVEFGNIYKMNVGSIIKIRLGYFTERKEAEDALQNVRKKGFHDAFITKESLIHSNMELLLSRWENDNPSDTSEKSKGNVIKEINRVYGLGGKYKVRLASYEDPIWFDINKVKDLGRIEQWTKGTWTIFILAGYENIDQAKDAQIQALNRGFKTAEVVIDNGGILERLKQN